jgi:20S proteasome subunit beta 7
MSYLSLHPILYCLLHHFLRPYSEPVVVGASVLAITYKDGIMIMADTGASYGSLARFTNIPRINKINSKVMLAYGGELSDYQYLERLLEEVVTEDYIEADGIVKGPEQIHSFVCRVMHNYRSKGNPLYNQIVTAGFSRDDKPYLAYCDLYGTNFTDNIVVTGFGMHMALPLLRKSWRPDMTKDEAKQILEDAMRVLVYRHCRTINKFTIATVEAGDVMEISEPYTLDTQWSYKRFVNPRAQE